MAKVKRVGTPPPVPAGDGPLTDEEAEKLSRWVEEEAEPADFRPRRGGRPPLGENFPSPRIQVRISRGAYDALVDQAHEEGTTLSRLVRRLLEHASEAQGA
jgi:hypothetical protein